MIEEMDLKNASGLTMRRVSLVSASEGLTSPLGWLLDQHESVGQKRDCQPKNLSRPGKRLVDGSSGDFNGRDLAVAGIEKDDTQNLLVEKLHIGARSVDRFRVVEVARTCVLSFGYCGYI